MKLFAQIVRTIVNVSTLPVDVIKDVGEVFFDGDTSFDRTGEKLQKIKDEAADEK